MFGFLTKIFFVNKQIPNAIETKNHGNDTLFGGTESQARYSQEGFEDENCTEEQKWEKREGLT